MSILMDDVEDKYVLLHGSPPRVHSAADPLFDLEYADDVLLMTKTREQMQSLVRLIEEEASLYAMSLNPDKVKLIAMNAPPGTLPIVLRSGSEVGSVNSWPYLGARISRDGKQTVNLAGRLSHAMSEFNKLTSFWAHASICTSLKLRIYKAVFQPMVLYALHYSWLTRSMCARLDSWQARTLRRVLRVKASMISRVSNASILRQAKCTPFSQQVRVERFRYFGHVLRSPYPDTVVSTCVDSSCKLRQPAGKRQRRRPLDNWTRKVTTEILDTASRTLPPDVRPPVPFKPATSGLLYARRLAANKSAWKRLQQRTDAPTGRRAGACARPGCASAAPAATPPRGAG